VSGEALSTLLLLRTTGVDWNRLRVSFERLKTAIEAVAS
jgi:hypothetical protein